MKGVTKEKGNDQSGGEKKEARLGVRINLPFNKSFDNYKQQRHFLLVHHTVAQVRDFRSHLNVQPSQPEHVMRLT
jgi:hypothetical protein